MGLSIKAISHIEGLASIENSWNCCVNDVSNNPFMLSGFLETCMELNRSRGWNPLFLTIYSDDEIVGFAPLMTRKKFGSRIASFILKPYYTPDIVVQDRFRTEFIAGVLDLLFQTLHCKFVDLTFPVETPNLRTLKWLCKAKQTYFSVEPYMGHRILPAKGTWEQFETFRGGSYRRRFRRMERKLKEAGLLRVSCVDGRKNESDVLHKVIEVEKTSWKEAWRVRQGETRDPELMMVWKGAGHAAEAIRNFKRTAWFLELDGHVLAYAIVLQYKKTAAIVKTSYDRRYRKFYPGMYIVNAAVRALFDDKSVNEIDYLTDMPFMDAWTALCRGRIRVLMGKGIMLTRMISLYRNAQMRRLLTAMSDRVRVRTQSAV